MASPVSETKTSPTPIITGDALKAKQNTYAEAFAQNIWREIEFLQDVSEERSQKRPKFTEKLIDLTFSVLGVGQQAAALIPGGDIAIGGALDIIQTLLLTQVGKKEEAAQEYFKGAILINDTNKEILKALFLQIGKEMALSLTYTLAKLEQNKIILLAHVGGRRALAYIASHKDLPMNTETLLRGIIRGPSGGGIEKFTNHELNGDSTVEGAYGRSAVVVWQ